MPIVHLDYEKFPRAEAEVPGMTCVTADPDLPGIAMAGNVPYAVHGSVSLRAQILYPLYQNYANAPKKDYPCIVHVHGSAWKKQDMYRRIPALCDLAKRGYVIVSAEYRPSDEAGFPAQIQDIKAAIRWVKEHAAAFNGDPEKIAIMGDSSGGHTALMVCLTEGIPMFEPADGIAGTYGIRGCIAMYAPTDLAAMNDFPTTMDHLSAGSPEGILLHRRPIPEISAEELAMASPLAWADKSKMPGPVLLVHGDKDDTVPFMLSIKMYQKLAAQQEKVEFCKVVNAGHGGVEFWTEEMIDVYDNFLQTLFG